MSEDAIENVVHHANGGVEIDYDGQIADVRFYCEGCGDLMDEFGMFSDQAEKHEDDRPVHDSASCVRKAKEVLEDVE